MQACCMVCREVVVQFRYSNKTDSGGRITALYTGTNRNKKDIGGIGNGMVETVD